MAVCSDKKAIILTDYLNGSSPEILAEKHGVSLRTINRWQKKEDWVKKKKIKEKLASENIFDKFQEKIEEICSLALDASRILAHISLSELEHLRVTNLKPPRHEAVKKSLESWGKIVLLSTNIQKNAIPESGQELSEKILKELEKINESVKEINKEP